ncbi:MAG: prolyl oligopeptidase family serine peptidase [Pseudomonadota bacterium]
MNLTGPRVEARSGKATSLMVFVHGYGADGNDLIGLAEPLGPHLPDTAFLAPNAPDRCTNNPMGYQWFPIPWLDGSSIEEATKGAARAAALLNAWLDALPEAEGIGPERTVLFGFSQGTMMSLEVGLRRSAPVAGIIGFSGRLLRPDALDDELTARPPILLVHGDQDEVVPPSSMPEAAAALLGAGLEVETHVSPGTGHGIAPDGLTLALQRTRGWLG